jgi:ribosomal protein S16
MLIIKLFTQKTHKKKIYKIFLINRKKNKILSQIGFYNPSTKQIKINKKLLTFYINYGVLVSNTLRHLLINNYLKLLN